MTSFRLHGFLPQPKRILDDAQADFAAERHQRFRMKLHAADRQRPMLERHWHAIIGGCRHLQHVGAGGQGP